MAKSQVADLQRLLGEQTKLAQSAISKGVELSAKCTELQQERDRYRQSEKTMAEALTSLRDELVEAKQQLQSTEMEVARLHGFIERVHEQDRAGDPDVIVERTEHHRPDRPPMLRLAPFFSIRRDRVDTACNSDAGQPLYGKTPGFDDAFRSARPRHRPNYGA